MLFVLFVLVLFVEVVLFVLFVLGLYELFVLLLFELFVLFVFPFLLSSGMSSSGESSIFRSLLYLAGGSEGSEVGFEECRGDFSGLESEDLVEDLRELEVEEEEEEEERDVEKTWLRFSFSSSSLLLISSTGGTGALGFGLFGEGGGKLRMI